MIGDRSVLLRSRFDRRRVVARKRLVKNITSEVEMRQELALAVAGRWPGADLETTTRD
jgi:hypothetical protein